MLNIKYEKGKYFINKENEKPYILDINTKVIIGKSGKQIKTLPITLNNFSRFLHDDNPQIYTLAQIKYYYSLDIDTTFNILLNVDKLINAGINTNGMTWNLSDIDVKHFIKYCKNNNIDKLNNNIVSNYKQQLLVNQINNKYPQFQAYDNAFEIYNRLETKYQKYFDIYGYYMLTRGYACLNIGNIIKQYIDDCIYLKIQPQKEKNFLQLAKDTHNTALAFKEKISEVKFEKNYKPHEKAFNFKTDNFSVVIPKSGNDLIIEGQKMHHCVGSYVQSVENNNTYIVFVRKNDNIDKPYITAQVDINGHIRQYYLSYDKTITEQIDIDFKKQFQDWLLNNW